jgi:uncharacterized membrane protein YtjA (UPF0391 family)
LIESHSLLPSWALTFLIVAIIAAVLSFGGIAGVAVEIAKIIFFVAFVLFDALHVRVGSMLSKKGFEVVGRAIMIQERRLARNIDSIILLHGFYNCVRIVSGGLFRQHRSIADIGSPTR